MDHAESSSTGAAVPPAASHSTEVGLRRSKRAVKRTAPTNAASFVSDPEPSPKKRKTSNVKKNSNAGGAGKVARTRIPRSSKLSMLPSMPIDALFEIFRNLAPPDLVKLSRTTKDFRSLLLNRNASLAVWRDSLRQVEGLPECPPDLSEPAWANLAFSPYCHFCSTRTPTVDWALRLRICNRCSEDQLSRIPISQKYRWQLLFRGLGLEGDDADLSSYLFYRLGKNMDLLCLKADYDAFMDHLPSLQTDQEKRDFLKERRTVFKTILSHALECAAWESSQIVNRRCELEELKKERCDAIIRKLDELGWGDEVKQIREPYYLEDHKLVNRPQRLTEKVWINIQSGILEFMAKMKRIRLEREYSNLKLARKGIAMEVVRAFKKTNHPRQNAHPGPREYCSFPVIEEIINLPANVNVDATSFENVVPLLPALFAEWRVKVDQELTQVLKRQCRHTARVNREHREERGLNGPISAPESEITDEDAAVKLKLACTIFINKPPSYYGHVGMPDAGPGSFAGKTILYPQVIEHVSCRQQQSYAFWCDETSSDDFQDEIDPSIFLKNSFRRRLSWNCESLQYNPIASKVAEAVVEAAGLDPASATSQDMDQEDARFMCEICWKESDENKALPHHIVEIALFEWRAMVRHLRVHKSNEISVIKLKRDDIGEDVKVAEQFRYLHDIPQWSCMHCLDTPEEVRPRSFPAVLGHLERTHKIATPVLDEDYFKHYTAPDINAHHRPLWVQRLPDGQLTVLPGLAQHISTTKYPDIVEDYQSLEDYCDDDDF